MSRYAIFSVTPEVLVEMAQHADPYMVQAIENRLPADAEIVGVNYNHERRCFDITLESSEFGEVPEGAKIPFLPATSFRQLGTPAMAVTP